ncbi:MAG: Sua5/YciO/YrdC/YwlC family protein [Mycoplasmatales bacterium]|nr:Sua5/YciO/YrdC/YwlC family protein [Mycoplasmatales bacterium]
MNYQKIFLTTTDTIVGIGAPMTEEGLDSLYILKKRPRYKRIIIMVGSLEQARSLEDWSEKAEVYAKKYWPGNTTLVLSDKQAVRLPGNERLANLIIEKGPTYMTSANISGGENLSLQEAREVFKDIKEYYDFGEGSGEASTIIRVEDGKVLR